MEKKVKTNSVTPQIHVPSDVDIWVHDIVMGHSKVSMRSLIYKFFPIGILLWYKANQTYKKEHETLMRIINENDVLATTLETYKAEHDGKILYLYHYASDSMLQWTDQRVVNYVKSFMHDEVYKHFKEYGGGTMFAEDISLIAYKIPLDNVELKDIRGYAQSDEVRKIVVKVYPTYLGTPEAIMKITQQSMAIFVVVLSMIILGVVFLV